MGMDDKPLEFVEIKCHKTLKKDKRKIFDFPEVKSIKVNQEDHKSLNVKIKSFVQQEGDLMIPARTNALILD